MGERRLLRAAAVCACAWLAACSDPTPTMPQAQFAGADDAGADAVAPTDVASANDAAPPPDASVANDVPTLADLVFLPDTPLANDVPKLADLVFLPDAPVADDAPEPPDVAVGVDLISWPDVQVATCGDGLCSPPLETAATCAADCAPPGWVPCAASACASAASACQASSGCASTLACASACASASCVQACTTATAYNTVSGTVAPLVQCAITAGCIAPFDAGPGGGPNSCGDGKCANGETHLTCPKDCGFPVTANEQCQVLNCAGSYAACAGDKGCVAAATCYNEYGSVNACAGFGQTANELGALINCIAQSCP